MSRPPFKLRWFSGRTLVIALPTLWLLAFFLLPFLIVLKISISEMEVVRFKDLITFEDGLLQLTLKLSNYTFIPGNSLLLNPLGLLDANGHASSTIAMPNQPGLVGVTLFATAATVPPQGLPAIKTIFPTPVRITIQ